MKSQVSLRREAEEDCTHRTRVGNVNTEEEIEAITKEFQQPSKARRDKKVSPLEPSES